MRASYVEQHLSRRLLPKWQPDLQQSVFPGCRHDTGGDQFLESQAVADFLQDLPAMPSQRRSSEQREQRSARELCRGSDISNLPYPSVRPTYAQAPILDERRSLRSERIN